MLGCVRRALFRASTARGTAAASFGSVRERSPYVVLGLQSHATKAEIKARFRALARLTHPDLNADAGAASTAAMAELIGAYDALMDDDLAGRIADSRVCFAAELFTPAELAADGLHDVYALRFWLDDGEGESGGGGEGEGEGEDNEDGEGGEGGEGGGGGDDDGGGGGDGDGNGEEEEGAAVVAQEERGEGSIGASSGDGDGSCGASGTGPPAASELDVRVGRIGPPLPVRASAHDSVSDLKRQLQETWGAEWGLGERRLDRDHLATGWEVVCPRGEVMSYHLFLHAYGVRSGEVGHVIIRRYEEGRFTDDATIKR